MASKTTRLAIGLREGSHGPLRGWTAARSPQFEGRFGRMFALGVNHGGKVEEMTSAPEVKVAPKT
jgi:hypothetical protein